MAMSFTMSTISFLSTTLKYILGLFGGVAISSGVLICRIEAAAVKTTLLAVAVRANTFTSEGMMLHSSPSRK